MFTMSDAHASTVLQDCQLELKASQSTFGPTTSRRFPSHVSPDTLRQANSSWMTSCCRWTVFPPKTATLHYTSLPLTGHGLYVNRAGSPTYHLDPDLVQSSSDNSPVIQAYGRLAGILASPEPLTVVYETSSTSSLSAALRLAAALDGYHKLDTDIIGDAEATRKLGDGSLGGGNLVVLTDGEGSFAKSLLSQNRTAFSLKEGSLYLRGKRISAGSAALFLHPHPSATDASILFIYAQGDASLERGLRLFPVRTGVPIPDWVVTTKRADEMGAGGIEGTGSVICFCQLMLQLLMGTDTAYGAMVGAGVK